MYCTTLVRSRSRGIGDGLTYDAGDAPVAPGSLIRVPLRKKNAEGIVLDIAPTLPEKTDFVVKAIEGIIGDAPLLTRAQILTLRWMAQYYRCTLRQAVGIFLPSRPWSALLQKIPARGSKSPVRAPVATGTLRMGWELTPAQRLAAETVKADSRPALLFGVTGSGKTAVYADLIAEAAARGKQSILLVPEILITEHVVDTFARIFERAAASTDAARAESRIAVLHSRLTPAARRAVWKRIRSGNVLLTIGSRSALFAPCPQLGLVIIDEEHEWTYKNEQTPRYHAREAAEMLCAAAGARLVLGSATPSLESWSRAKSGRYALVRLPDRFATHAPARVRVIDLGSTAFGDHYPFSPPLLQAIADRLANGQQSVLFLNRRGMATSLLCMQCRKRAVSPDSGIPYTVHRTASGKPVLVDHFSGETGNVPDVCPTCGSINLRLVGAGTQKLEDILARVFPAARILRADSDVLSRPEQMRGLLQAMEERRADILIGTQSVVKGLHLPRVTLAAVLLADVGLSLPHFRAGERAFQLLTQLTGRSGREEPGDVIIQTFRPDAPEVIAAASQTTEQYLDRELKARALHGYPPASSLIRVIVTGPDASSRAKKLQQRLLDRVAAQKFALHITCAPTLFGGGRTWHLFIRGQNPRALLDVIEGEDVAVDIDPMECL